MRLTRMTPRLLAGGPRARRWATALVVSAVMASAMLGASLAAPAGAAALGPLPACRYLDILTEPRGYDDWAITLVDTILRVPSTYVPPDLQSVTKAGIEGSGLIRAVAISDLRAMAAAAKAAGNPIAVQSAYRSYATQQATFQYWVSISGYNQALLYSARPGHSEHQLGLAIDFKSAAGAAPWSGTDWGLSPAGTWMRLHAWEYGWVESYPKGEQSLTCYAYEAWHFRYVGRELAAEIHASGLTPREYLWANFTTAIVPSPGASPKPSPSPTPSEAPSASPTDSPSAEPSPTDSPSPSPAATDASLAPRVAPDGPSPAAASVDPWLIVGVGGLAVLLAGLGAAAVARRRGQARPEPPG